MATFGTTGFLDLGVAFDKLERLPDEDVIDKMLQAEGNIVAQATKSSAERNKVRDTGRLISSIGLSKVKQIKKGKNSGRKYVLVRFSGTRSDGATSNGAVAFFNEFGVPRKTGKQEHGRNFIKQANESSIDSAVSAAEKIYDNYLSGCGF